MLLGNLSMSKPRDGNLVIPCFSMVYRVQKVTKSSLCAQRAACTGTGLSTFGQLNMVA